MQFSSNPETFWTSMTLVRICSLPRSISLQRHGTTDPVYPNIGPKTHLLDSPSLSRPHLGVLWNRILVLSFFFCINIFFLLKNAFTCTPVLRYTWRGPTLFVFLEMSYWPPFERNFNLSNFNACCWCLLVIPQGQSFYCTWKLDGVKGLSKGIKTLKLNNYLFATTLFFCSFANA